MCIRNSRYHLSYCTYNNNPFSVGVREYVGTPEYATLVQLRSLSLCSSLRAMIKQYVVGIPTRYPYIHVQGPKLAFQQ
jgi:hypothetical protein